MTGALQAQQSQGLGLRYSSLRSRAIVSETPEFYEMDGHAMPLISVVIPSYNHRQYIGQAIRSVLDLDYESIELIIIDDGSTDGSSLVIREAIADNKGRRIVFAEQSNAGAHVAIVQGMNHARGDILTILNSDDFYEPDRFSIIVRAVPKTGDFIAFTQVRYVNEDGGPLGPESEHRKWYKKALSEATECPTVGYGLLRNNFSVTSGNLVFTRSLYERLGGFRNYKLCHDWDFLIRAVHFVEPIYLSKPLMSYRVHKLNTVNSVLHLFLQEGVPCINSFVALGLDEKSPNPLAPNWANWPVYFDYFINSYSSWFASEPIRNFLNREAVIRPCISIDSWGTGTTQQDLGYAVRLECAQPSLDSYALLRELAQHDEKATGARSFGWWLARIKHATCHVSANSEQVRQSATDPS